MHTDDMGVVHTVAVLSGIRRSLREGLLGDADNVRVARQKMGPFEALRTFAEFRDLVVQPAKLPQPSGQILPSHSKMLEKPKSMPAPATSPSGATVTVAGDSAILATTTIGMAAVQAATAAAAAAAKSKSASVPGPRINLVPAESAWTPEYAKYFAMALFFGGLGILATFFMPTIIRYIRFM